MVKIYNNQGKVLWENKALKSLSGANLSGACLIEANLSRVYLRGANLSGADLSWANLSGACLIEANLSRVYLRGANLRGADLSWANLRGACLREADLNKVVGLDFQIPQEGELVVWKRVSNGLAKLKIPADAARTATPLGRKCRAEFALVLEARRGAFALHTSQVEYRPGSIVRPDKWDPDWRVECTHGIHFFLTKEEAENY